MEAAMADEFGRFLAGALAPPPRKPDRFFVASVQAHIALDDRLRAERAATVSDFALQLLALLAVAAGLIWFARSPQVAGAVGESPGVALLILVGLFSFLVLLLSPGVPASNRFDRAARGFSTT
jgi:ABC-type transport system involved in cytochrome bd biosynthesis fused ATPase/permease subunit